MHTDELLEACLQALTSGQEIPPEITRYLARHPEQRAEVEELIFVAQRASNLPPAELSSRARVGMQQRLAARMGVDTALLDARSHVEELAAQHAEPAPATRRARAIRLLATGRASLARLRYASMVTSDADEVAAARIRTAFKDLTPEDIRRYIGERGEDYLYYRQRFPRWEVVFAALALILRGFKRLEKLAEF
jgi:DNA-binding MarR family transcriptional regulator